MTIHQATNRRAFPRLPRVAWPLALCLCACAPVPEDQILSADYGMTMCPKGAVVEGVDVSHYDGAIDWAKARGAGKRFAIMKATESTGYVDPTFKTNWKDARAQGLFVGAYHFFRANADPIQQADHFLQTTGMPGAGDLPLVADVETADGESGAVISMRVKQFLDALQMKTGRTPMIYTSPGFFGGTMGNPQGFEKYLLWDAHWQVNCPNVPGSWKNWTFWQYSDKGMVAGINSLVDLDRFNGSIADLMTLTGGGCAPMCGGHQCGDDGCGGSCGACGGGMHCSPMGQCVAAPVDAGSAADLSTPFGGDGAAPPAEDAASPPVSDAGTTSNDAANKSSDGAAPTSDAARPSGDGALGGNKSVQGGCQCQLAGTPRSPRGTLGFLFALSAIAAARRRRARSTRGVAPGAPAPV